METENPMILGMPKPDDKFASVVMLCHHGEQIDVSPETLGIDAVADDIRVKNIIAVATLVFMSEYGNEHITGWIVNYREDNEWRLQLSADGSGPIVVWGIETRTDDMFTDRFAYGMPVAEWAGMAMEFEATGQFPDVQVR